MEGQVFFSGWCHWFENEVLAVPSWIFYVILNILTQESRLWELSFMPCGSSSVPLLTWCLALPRAPAGAGGCLWPNGAHDVPSPLGCPEQDACSCQSEEHE